MGRKHEMSPGAASLTACHKLERKLLRACYASGLATYELASALDRIRATVAPGSVGPWTLGTKTLTNSGMTPAGIAAVRSGMVGTPTPAGTETEGDRGI